MILEGSRLHYGEPRVVQPDDPDLALLLGDQLYALGLSRLAALGDLDAVAELADVISLVAQAHAAGDADLAEAVWEAGAVAVGWGARPGSRPQRRRRGPRPRRGRAAAGRCGIGSRRGLLIATYGLVTPASNPRTDGVSGDAPRSSGCTL